MAFPLGSGSSSGVQSENKAKGGKDEQKQSGDDRERVLCLEKKGQRLCQTWNTDREKKGNGHSSKLQKGGKKSDTSEGHLKLNRRSLLILEMKVAGIDRRKKKQAT